MEVRLPADAISKIDFKNAHKVVFGNLLGRLEGLDADGRIILKWLFK